MELNNMKFKLKGNEEKMKVKVMDLH